MRHAIAVGLAVCALAGPALAEPALRRSVAPMTRADGEVCDLLRAQAKDRCKAVAQDGSATVYQSGGKIRRLVLAIAAGDDVLVSPAVDLIGDQLASATPTLRSVAIDGQPGVVLDVVSTWKPGAAVDHSESLVGCAPVDGIWKCAQLDVGACDASIADDGAVTTSCGTRSSLSPR
jgi:hypothetical protein